jgi:hypothetical protein
LASRIEADERLKEIKSELWQAYLKELEQQGKESKAIKRSCSSSTKLEYEKQHMSSLYCFRITYDSGTVL